MIENQDGTFTWETGDIITAEKMNKLLEKNTCHVIGLEMKTDEENRKNYIEASYNDLLSWIKHNNIIYIKTPLTTDNNIVGNAYVLLQSLLTDNNNPSQPIWTARFAGTSFDSSIGPDSYLYRVSAL